MPIFKRPKINNMPLPTPAVGETQTDFIARCMSSDIMKMDYKDRDQRYAVCQTQWSNKKND